MVPLGILG